MSWRRWSEAGLELLIRLCGLSAILFVFGIFILVLWEGHDFLLHRLDFVEFFTSIEWRPTDPVQPTYGVLALITGTAGVGIVAMGIAVPFSLGCAVFVSEFCAPRARETLKVIIELLAAIPSVVWGFIGLTLINSLVIKVTGEPVGLCVLNAGVILALMSVPIIVSIAEDALKAVPDGFREAAEALGATKWEVIYKVLFPAARHGLLAAVLLGIGRVVGETMAVLMASGHSIRMPIDGEFPYVHPLSPARTLTATIAAELGETPVGSDHYQALFVIGLLLFIITFGINLLADVIVKGIRAE